MNPTHSTYPSTVDPVSVTVAKFNQRLYVQRIAIVLLLMALSLSVLYGSIQSFRVDMTREMLVHLRGRPAVAQPMFTATPAAEPAVQTAPIAPSGAAYPVTLIGDDDSRTPLKGKALQIDLGGGRLLEVNLQRNQRDFLNMWSPYKRGDSHLNLVVFHPYCANAYALELDRRATKSVAADPSVSITEKPSF